MAIKNSDNKSLLLYTSLIFVVAIIMIIVSFFAQTHLNQSAPGEIDREKVDLSAKAAQVSEENMQRLKKRNVRLVMAAHHHLVNHVKNLDFDLPIELMASSEISHWIRHASPCITDYSSVCFDFLFLDKPCVFWTPDRHDGLLHGDDYAEVVFAEHQGANMFNRVKSVDEVLALVEKYADGGFALEPEKREIANRYFAYRGDISKRLYDQICAIDGKEINA